LHFVAQSKDLPRDVKRFKSYTARSIIDYLKQKNVATLLKQLDYYKKSHKVGSEFQLWQERSHPCQIESEKMMREKLEYIHSNPVKRGYVDRPEHWRYSSARNYLGEEGLIEVCTEW
jgi:REP element-mobilizing transposase RayT